MILDRFRLDGRDHRRHQGNRPVRDHSSGPSRGRRVRGQPQPGPDSGKRNIALGRKYYHWAADLPHREQTREIVPEMAAKLGGLDILVNNAGLIRRAPAAEYPESDWDATMEIDLNAAFILSPAVGRLMLAAGRGKIINVVSVLAFQGGINVAAYATAKHGLAGLTKALANEWAGRGVNVNALAPGYIATELTDTLQNDPDRSQAITGRTPAGRWGRPKDITGAAVFLASPAQRISYTASSCPWTAGGWPGEMTMPQTNGDWIWTVQSAEQ